MAEDDGCAHLSFPVTIWYEPETGNIHILRRTEPEHRTQISPDPRTPDGHAELYMSLLNLLMDEGGKKIGQADKKVIAKLLGRVRPCQ